MAKGLKRYEMPSGHKVPSHHQSMMSSIGRAKVRVHSTEPTAAVASAARARKGGTMGT